MNKLVKRMFDILVSAFLLILLVPLLYVVSRKIAKNLGKPVLFRQKRPGLNGETFEMTKFRSMRNAVDSDGNALPDSDRLTPFGD